MLAENESLYREFLEYYKPRVSQSGYETIKYIVRSLILWFDEKELIMSAITVEDVMNYKKSLNNPHDGRKLSIGSIYNYLKMGRKLFRFMQKFEKVNTNPFSDVKYPRLPDSISNNILNEAQMNRLLKSFKKFNVIMSIKEKLNKYRLHVLTVLLYSTGMRIAEAAALLPEDIDVKRREVIIRNGKGGKSRIAFLSGYVSDVLDFYIQHRNKLLLERIWQKKHNDKLFGASLPTLKTILNKALFKTCKTLKIPVITCHGFRHSMGTHLLRSGCDMRHIQVILGHKHLNSTQRYTRVDRRDLRNIIDRYHPRQMLKKKILV